MQLPTMHVTSLELQIYAEKKPLLTGYSIFIDQLIFQHIQDYLTLFKMQAPDLLSASFVKQRLEFQGVGKYFKLMPDIPLAKSFII